MSAEESKSTPRSNAISDDEIQIESSSMRTAISPSPAFDSDSSRRRSTTSSITYTEADESAVRNHVILFSIDTVNALNNRDFALMRSMRHSVSRDFTGELLDHIDHTVIGWEEYVSAFEQLATRRPDSKWLIKDIHASVNMAAGTAEVYLQVEQVGQFVGIRTTVSSVSSWRRPGKKWYLKQRKAAEGTDPDFVERS